MLIRKLFSLSVMQIECMRCSGVTLIDMNNINKQLGGFILFEQPFIVSEDGFSIRSEKYIIQNIQSVDRETAILCSIYDGQMKLVTWGGAVAPNITSVYLRESTKIMLPKKLCV